MKPWFCTVLNIYNFSYGSVADRAASHTVLLILMDIWIIGKLDIGHLKWPDTGSGSAWVRIHFPAWIRIQEGKFVN